MEPHDEVPQHQTRRQGWHPDSPSRFLLFNDLDAVFLISFSAFDGHGIVRMAWIHSFFLVKG